MGRKGPVYEKAFNFAVEIVKTCRVLQSKKEFVISKQLMRSGTSIGANIREGIEGQSRRDFAAKMSIALKEACETEYWLDLLKATEMIEIDDYQRLISDNKEIVRMLNAILVTTRKNGL